MSSALTYGHGAFDVVKQNIQQMALRTENSSLRKLEEIAAGANSVPQKRGMIWKAALTSLYAVTALSSLSPEGEEIVRFQL